ncbi:MAG: biopolymer transporter ExbD [Saprospiraceae bacterium]
MKIKRKTTEPNAGSMADIAFLLLIFFLVATTIEKDEGIQVKLPAWEGAVQPLKVPENNILTIALNAKNEILLEGSIVRIEEVRPFLKRFILNKEMKETWPQNPQKTAVSFTVNDGTNYEAYLEVYNELKAGYREMWEEKAEKDYGKPLEILSEKIQLNIKTTIPMVIMENESETGLVNN